MEGYFTVLDQSENLIVIKKSKFICSIKRVEDEDDAKRFVESIRKKHSLATHNCYAYIADEKGMIQKFSDDGEPQGTAGMPMLDVLKAKRFYKTAVVVTRYFGGTLLGAGGLVRAYSGAVADCINNAKIVNMQPAVVCEISVDYTTYSKIAGHINGEFIKVLDSDFSNGVKIKVVVREDLYQSFVNKIIDITLGTAIINEISRSYHGF
jgi:uncharacterized YigZ family protein